VQQGISLQVWVEINMTREAYLQSYRIRFLVTGGAGFIGSHLCEALLENEHFVVALDNLQTGSLANIEHLLAHPNFLFVEDSVLNEGVLAKYMGMCDIAVHLAAAVGVKFILDHPIESLAVNIAGTEMLLAKAADFRKRVFLASTSEVYGKQTGEVLRETDDLRIGSTAIFRWSYACSKALDEFMALAQARSHGLPVVVGRLFNTVGPRQVGNYGMVIPRFVERALAGEPLLVHGKGTQSRTFTHVRDAVEVIYRLVMSPAAWGQVYNIAGSEAVTINELARRVLERTGSASPLEYVPYNQVYGPDFEDIERRVPCLKKLRSAIGSLPQRGLNEILDDVIAEKRQLLLRRLRNARPPREIALAEGPAAPPEPLAAPLTASA
jgi:UDP-glucose 4-epimerase